MLMLKKIIQTFLRIFNLKLVKLKTHVLPEIPFDLFEYVLVKVLHDIGPSFRFVQIGANDTQMDSNFLSLVRNYKITGCLVEHKPEIFERQRSIYFDQPQIFISNINIYSTGNAEKTVCLKSNNKFKIAIKFIEKKVFGVSFGKHSQDTQINDLVKNGNIEVEVQTLKKLCQDLQYDKLHLLYVKSKIDSDSFIYKALDEKICPLIIKYEWTEMGLAQNYKLKMRLLDEGYRFIDVGADTVCVME
jgi:hypothetical protein